MQRRPTLKPRRASGPSESMMKGNPSDSMAQFDPFIPRPTSAALARQDSHDLGFPSSPSRSPSFANAESHAALGPAHRSNGNGTHLSSLKLTRSASSSTHPFSQNSSLPGTRPESMGSASGGVDTATAGTTTASPVHTPKDVPSEEHVMMPGTQHSIASSPSLFSPGSKIFENTRVITHSIDSLDNNASSLSWSGMDSTQSSQSPPVMRKQDAAPGKPATKILHTNSLAPHNSGDELSSLTEKLRLGETDSTPSLNNGTNRGSFRQEAYAVSDKAQKQHALYSQPSGGHYPQLYQEIQHAGPPFVAQPIQPQYFMSNSESFPSSVPQGSFPIMHTIDPASFDAYRTNTDQYPLVYGMAPTSVASSSTPQSPSFVPHHSPHSSDSSMFMYSYGGFPNVMPRPPPLPPSGPGTGAPSAATPVMIQGVPTFPQQSPVMISPVLTPADRSSQREHVQAFNSSGPLPTGSWATPPTSASGYLHGHSPSWSQSDMRSMHRRMISGPYQLSQMGFSQPSPHSYGRPPSRVAHSRTPSSLSFGSHSTRAVTENTHRSPLLEEFRQRHHRGRRFELSDIKGAVVEFSGDQHGSRFTQEKLDNATEEELQMVFDEILPHARQLMMDVFGNYVIQKMIEHGNVEMRTKLMQSMHGHILELSLGTYGCRVVQKALEFVEPMEQIHIADELRESILTCVQDQNANHVVQKVLEQISPSFKIDFIPTAFRGNVYKLAAHCYSCRVLQRIFEHCDATQTTPLFNELFQNTERLMHDQYGNYVIQWVLSKGNIQDKERIIRLAQGNVLKLARHKFASNVMEEIIKAANPNDCRVFLDEILQPLPNDMLGSEPAVVAMMKDQYGNYVLQRFLERAEGEQKEELVSAVKPALQSMRRFSGGYTKHFSAIEKLLDAPNIKSNTGTVIGVSAPHAGRNIPKMAVGIHAAQ